MKKIMLLLLLVSALMLSACNYEITKKVEPVLYNESQAQNLYNEGLQIGALSAINAIATSINDNGYVIIDLPSNQTLVLVPYVGEQ